MKSGLYACAGASATASAAACAKRFDEPITNRSKVYLGLMPATCARGASACGRTTGSSAPSETTRRTDRSVPVASLNAARIRPAKCPSIHSRVKSLGTATTSVSPVTSTPQASPNQLR